MDPKEFLKVYTQVFREQESPIIDQDSSQVITLLPKNYYYPEIDCQELYLDTLSRSNILDFIQSLGFVENNQRITTKQISIYLSRLKYEVTQRQVEIDGLINELNKHRLEIEKLTAHFTDQLAVSVMERNLETQSLRNDISSLNGTIANLHSTIIELQTSTSWRVTMPLRFLSMIIRKSKRWLYWFARQFVRIVRIVYRFLPLSIYRRVQIRRFYLKLYRLIKGEKIEHIVNPFAAIEKSYPTWFAARNFLTPRAVAKIRTAIEALASPPLISIVLPVYNPPLDFITSAIASVQTQIYENWELCIADDASDPEVAATLRQLIGDDQRIKLIHLETNLGISGATNQALQLATGQWVGFLDHDDLLDPAALFFVARALAENPDTDVVYTDRDFVTAEGQHVDPYFKPDWSPLALLEHNYVIHFLVVRRTLLVELGGLRAEFNGAQDYDLVLRLAERTDRVRHIPEILYSWRRHPASNSGLPQPAAFEAGRRAISAALQRRGLNGTVDLVGPSGPYHVRLIHQGQPLISIIISSRNPKLLRACIDTLRAKTTYPNIEILLATNAVGNVELQGTCEELGLRLVEVENGFFSRMNNAAARAACGEFLLFLNDDTEVVTPDWLETLLAFGQIPGVAAVGPRLVYPDGRTQLTRLVSGIRRDGRPYFFDPFDYYGVDAIFGFSLHVISEVLGVSGGCMLTPRQLFLDSGGFEEETFSFSYQDADWTLRVRATGQSMVFTPHAVVVHYGQFSKKEVPDMLSREIQLANAFFTLHRTRLMRGDPFWNPALLDVQGLLDPPRFPGNLRLELPEAPPQVGHSLVECTPFQSEFGEPGEAAAARAACRKFVDRLVKVTGCRTVIDVGCGAGFLVEALAEHGLEAWGVDRSSAVVAAVLPSVRDRVVLGELGEAGFFQGLTKVRSFDVAICAAVLECLPEDLIPEALQQLAQLAPRVVVITPRPNLWDRLNPYCRSLHPREVWLHVFRQVGLCEESVESTALFGVNYDHDPDMTLVTLKCAT